MTELTLDRTVDGSRRPVVYRPDSAVFWVFVGAMAVGSLSLLFNYGAAFRITLNAELALAPLWLAFMVFLVWLILRFDPFRAVRRYPQALVAAAALGATAACAMAIAGNTAVQQLLGLVLPAGTVTQWSAAISAPVIEETSKGLCAAVILLLCSAVMTRIAHALLIGMFVGFGFDVMEDLTYSTNSALQDLGSDIGGAGTSLVVRAFTSVPAHWSYTAMTSVGILLLLPSFTGRGVWSTRRRVVTACGLFFSAWLMHFVWDSPTGTNGFVAVAALPLKVLFDLGLFLGVVMLLLREERKWLVSRIEVRRTEELRRFRPELLDSLTTWRKRRALRKAAKKTAGRSAARRVKAHQREALDTIQGIGEPQS
jgi:RsiW-degrading membrane proteinase PrsW (M82 family)